MKKRQKRREDPQTTRVLRARRRKRHRMLFRVLCCLLVCVAAVFATTIFFRVSDMQVTGTTRYKAENIIGTSGVQEGDNLFFLHTKTIVQALENTYPYLDTVQIKRHLPGTLEIAVTERTPLVCVKAGDGQYYVDKQGKVLEKVSGTPNAGIITLVGAGTKTLQVGTVLDSTSTDGNSDTNSKASSKYEKIHSALELLNLFESYDMLDAVCSVDMTKSFDVKLNYDDRYTIEFGTLDDLEYKIQFLKAILKRDDLPETGIIDLSQGDKAHYRPAETDTTATDTESDSSTDSSTAETEQSTSSDDSNTANENTDSTAADDTDQTDTSADTSEDTVQTDNAEGDAGTDQSAQ